MNLQHSTVQYLYTHTHIIIISSSFQSQPQSHLCSPWSLLHARGRLEKEGEEGGEAEEEAEEEEEEEEEKRSTFPSRWN